MRTTRMKAVLLGLVILQAGLLGSAARSAAADPPDPVFITTKDANGVEGIQVTGYVKADPALVWSVISDVIHIGLLFENVKNVKFMKDLPSTPPVISAEYEYTFSSPLGIKIVDIEVDRNPATRTSTWKRLAGDLSAFEGQCVVTASTDYPGYTKFVYGNFIDGGFFAPQVITDSLNRTDIENMLPKLRDVLLQKQQAGGSGGAS